MDDARVSTFMRQHRRDRRIAVLKAFAVLLIVSVVMLLATHWLWSVLTDAGQPVTAYAVAVITFVAIGFMWWVGMSVGIRRV